PLVRPPLSRTPPSSSFAHTMQARGMQQLPHSILLACSGEIGTKSHGAPSLPLRVLNASHACPSVHGAVATGHREIGRISELRYQSQGHVPLLVEPQPNDGKLGPTRRWMQMTERSRHKNKTWWL